MALVWLKESACGLERNRLAARQRGHGAELAVVAVGLLSFVGAAATSPAAGAPVSSARIRVDSGHPWRPPFGLERIGQPLTVTVEMESNGQPSREYTLLAFLDGKVVGRHAVRFTSSAPRRGKVTLQTWPSQLVLLAQVAGGEPIEVARQAVASVSFEAAVVARPDRVVQPVDLGTILVPADWLLLAGGQSGTVEVAAICRSRDIPLAHVRAWFESRPAQSVSSSLALLRNRRAQCSVPLPPAAAALDHDVLHVDVSEADGKELWHKTIRTMLVPAPPKWPDFGATETLLWYDDAISVLAADGTLSSMDYDKAWDPRRKDVVVSLPNGARFVFWRGSSYIPFWAGRYNTGLCYEWAETTPPADGFVDSVEPLMDKELRYGRVTVVESTAARVHVRWSYQSCDFNPLDKQLPPVIYRPFFDRGVLVTPAYWGSHWPLARGKTTGGSIDDRLYLTPAHNSLMTWGFHSRPKPLQAETVDTVDTLGRARRMSVQRWSWLIGSSAAADERLLEWARCYAQPPSLRVQGGHVDRYVPERRAHRIIVDCAHVTIQVEPRVRYVNPVFELVGAPKALVRVRLGSCSLAPEEYAWDGEVLWLASDVTGPTVVQLTFDGSPASCDVPGTSHRPAQDPRAADSRPKERAGCVHGE